MTKVGGVPAAPTVAGDPDATITGDAETGFVVKPSAKNENVVVEIPDGVDAAKVTVKGGASGFYTIRVSK